MKPIVSIITPVYNRPELIEQAIKSVIRQTNPSWEHIVIDDRSEDETWDVIQRYRKIDNRIFAIRRDREPKGAQTCRNIGIEMARSDYLIFLDSDDIILPHCIAQRVDFLNNNYPFDLAVFPFSGDHKKEHILYRYLSYNIPFQTTNSFWYKPFLTKIGSFNEKLKRFQDVEVTIRALLKEQIEFKISTEHKPDSEYNYDGIISEGIKSGVVYDALTNFVIEIVTLLKKKKKKSLRPILKFYLRSWLIHYHSEKNYFQTEDLLELFREHKIISKWMRGIVRASLFIFTSNLYKIKVVKKVIYYPLFRLLK